MEELANAVHEHIEALKDQEIALQKMGGAEQILVRLHQSRRQLELQYHDFLKTGVRVAITKELVLECPACHKDMMDNDHLYLHLRRKHGVSEEEAAVQSRAAEAKHEEAVNTLRKLLPEYTGVDLTDEFTDHFREVD